MDIEVITMDYMKRIVALEAECEKLNMDKVKLEGQVMEEGSEKEKTREKYVKVKGKYVKETEKFVSGERKWSEEVETITEKCRQVEMEKRKLEIDLKEAQRRIINSSADEVERMITKVEDLKSLLEESNNTITTLLAKNAALENHLRRSEMDFEAEKLKVEEEKVLELTQKVEAVERGKREMEAALCKMKEDYSHEVEKNLNLNKAFESARKALEEASKKASERVVERVNEAEKRAIENDAMVKKEMSEKIKRILKENTTLKEMHEKKILEFVATFGNLEREKHELRAEITEKDEKIKFLVQEKERLSAKEKTMEVEKNWCAVKLEKDVALQLPQQVHPTRNLGILSSVSAQNQDPKPVDVSVTEPEESSDGRTQLRGVLTSDIQKRKVAGLGCPLVNQAGTTRCKLVALTERKLLWKNGGDMFIAFTDNDELCMKSVCALYRKFKPLGEWKNRLMLYSNTGFIHPFETRGMALGELLTSSDQEGRLKKSLAELEQADPQGLHDCRLIAWDHYLELFDIYRSNLDPLFISADDIN